MELLTSASAVGGIHIEHVVETLIDGDGTIVQVSKTIKLPHVPLLLIGIIGGFHIGGAIHNWIFYGDGAIWAGASSGIDGRYSVSVSSCSVSGKMLTFSLYNPHHCSNVYTRLWNIYQ